MSDVAFTLVALATAGFAVVGMMTVLELAFDAVERLVRLQRAKHPFVQRVSNVERAIARNEALLRRIRERMEREAARAPKP